MLAWSIEAGRAAKTIDRLVLSSDDPEIISVAAAHGCEVPFVRPAELARDEVPGIAPVLHALDQLPGFEWVILLQPTSPLRTAQHIDDCAQLCVQENAPFALSVVESSKPLQWFHAMDDRHRLTPLFAEPAAPRRQDAAKAFIPNGAVYVARVTDLRAGKTFLTDNSVGYCMPAEASIDIDGELDLLLAELLLQRRLHGNSPSL